jgi:hypothetical protein
MNRRTFLTGSGIALAAQASGQTQASNRAAFCETDISPKIGMEQPGGYGKAYLRAFHDPCKARAVVIEGGSVRVALVGLDSLVAPRRMVQSVRQRIQKLCGIPADRVLIGASHSHSAGPLFGAMPGDFDHASDFVRHLVYDASTIVNPEYMRMVEDQIVAAVAQANNDLAPMQFSFGFGHEDKVAFNRRFLMRNGQTWTHPGQGNPDIVKPAGPIDPQVGVIGIWKPSGELAGCIVNYACHATTGPGGISADWIYYLEQAVRGQFGASANVVFLQGYCGDITQVDNQNPYRQPTGLEYAKFVGGRIGAEANKVLLTAVRGDAGAIAARTRVMRIPHRIPNPERVKHCLEIAQRDPTSVDATEWTFAKEIIVLDAMLSREKDVEVETQAIQIGPAACVTGPGEMFCDFGLELKKNSPFKFTFPVELANGSVGYVPTEEAFGDHGGGYETRLTSYSNLEIHAGTRLTAEGTALLKSLTPGPAPTPAPPLPFKQPWRYGNVKPEA